jgi:AraC-like DNA-binding protein
MKTPPTHVQVSIPHDTGTTRLEVYHYSPGFFTSIAPHAHDEYQFGFSPDGGGGFQIGSHWHPTSPGLLHCVAPGVEHATGQAGQLHHPAVYYVLYVDQLCLDSLLPPRGVTVSQHAARGCLSSRGCAAQQAPDFGMQFFKRAGQPMDALAQQESLSQLIERLQILPDKPATDPIIARQIRDALMDDLFGPHDLHEIAHRLHMHPATVRAVFKHAYGMPPARFRMLKRLHVARQRLAQGTPPATVAAACRFFDQAHLTRLLKRYFGHGCSAFKSN